MACERLLRKHIDCAKGFLRESRIYNLQYEPGCYTVHDRCQYTRESYVECRMAPEIVAPTADRPSKVKQIVQPRFIKKGQPIAMAGSSESKGPPPCQRELNLHGMCTDIALRNIMSKGVPDYTHYIDKCANSRKMFDKCMTGIQGDAVALESEKARLMDLTKLELAKEVQRIKA